jgi:hypothetical protein
MINNLVERDGWRAHETVHHIFTQYLDILYRQLGQPLHSYVLAVNLQTDLRQHMKFEETDVIPAYGKLLSDYPVSGKPGHFLDDHSLLRQHTENLTGLLLHAAFEPVPPAMVCHAVVQLDKLLEHHDEREMDYLYPALHAALNNQQRATLLERMKTYRITGPENVLGFRNQLLDSSPVRELSARYSAWLELRELGQPDNPALLDKVFSKPLLPHLSDTGYFPLSLRKLLERTIVLTKKFLSGRPESLRACARVERQVDKAWRSTIAFAIHAASRNLAA